MKLDAGQKHILRLIERDRNTEGWATIGGMLYKTLSANIPVELATFEKLEVGGRARLTDEGQNVLNAMDWL